MTEERYWIKYDENGKFICICDGKKELNYEQTIDKLNYLEQIRKEDQMKIDELREITRLMFDTVHGFKAYKKLADEGWF